MARQLMRRNRSPSPYDTARSQRRAEEPSTDIWEMVSRHLKKKRVRRSRALKGIWDTLFDANDITQFRPKLASDIEIKSFPIRWGNDYTIIANRRDFLLYRLEPGEVEALGLMDGTRTVGEIVVERFEQTGELDLQGIAELTRMLEEGNFLEQRFLDTDQAVKTAIRPPKGWSYRLGEFLKNLRIDWYGANAVVEWLYHHGLKYAFSRWAQPLLIGASLFGLYAFWSYSRTHNYSLLEQSAAKESLILIALSWLLTVLHELGHALVLTRYGRRIKNAGFLIYFGSPALFVESTDGLMLDRKERILQSFAGPYTELFVAGTVSILAWAFPDAAMSATLYKFAALNYFVIFLNLVPLLELDGYWILSDWLQVPDLRRMSLNFVRHDLWFHLRRRLKMSKQQLGLALYGILGILFTILSLYTGIFYWTRIFGSLVAALWNGGLGTRILLFVLALFLAGPLIRGGIGLIRSGMRTLKALWTRLRFRLETQWRVEAAELIDALPTFEDLPVELLNDLSGHVKLRTFPEGQAIVRQGDEAEAFYVVRSGKLHVIEELPDNNERMLRTLGRGSAFGELGLVDAAPRRATVRAAEPCEVFEIDKATFDRLLVDRIDVEDVAPTAQSIADLRRLPCFSHMETDELSALLDHGEWVNFPPDTVIVREKSKGDEFYAIGSGQVAVIRGRKQVRTMGPGEFFGEIALLLDVPRTATVKAVTPVRAFMVDRRGFNKLMKRAFRKGVLHPQAPAERIWKH